MAAIGQQEYEYAKVRRERQIDKGYKEILRNIIFDDTGFEIIGTWNQQHKFKKLDVRRAERKKQEHENVNPYQIDPNK